MTDIGNLRSWMFATLAVDDVLNNLERDGLAVRPENDPAAVQRVLPLEAFSREIRRSAMRALPAYLAMFCLENAIRELVAERLSEDCGSN